MENHRNSCGSIFNKCSTCDKSFIKKKYLKAHLKTHETKKKRDNLEPLNCYECGKNFERLKYLKAHKKTHNPKPENVPVSCIMFLDTLKYAEVHFETYCIKNSKHMIR